MPKKITTNQKSVDARARKDAIKTAEKERVEKAKQDALWKDDDKQLAKKQARKDDKERKEAEERERKKEREKLLQEEMSQLKSKETKEPKAQKVTRAQIESRLETPVSTPKKADNVVVQDEILTENINRLQIDGDSARTMEEAISVLSQPKVGEIDRHPERRAKAAYDTFEATRLAQLKAENSNLRLSQLRQLIRKEWMKSPENPLNQRLAAYNTKVGKQATTEGGDDE